MLNFLRNEGHYFLLAVGFFTRIPVPNFPYFNTNDLSSSAKYFPLIGVIVGVAGAGVFALTTKILPNNISILLSMAMTIYITGALHEDGLADSADGLGGAWDKDRILSIMQDSRLGTYGAIALFLMLFAKFHVLNSLPTYSLPFIIIIGHAFSRLCALYLMADLDYIKTNGKAKPLATKIESHNLALATILGFLPIVFIYFNSSSFIFNLRDWLLLGVYSLLPVGFVWLWWRSKIKQWLGGYTGDCLGAMQQITELAFYFGLLAWYQQS